MPVYDRIGYEAIVTQMGIVADDPLPVDQDILGYAQRLVFGDHHARAGRRAAILGSVDDLRPVELAPANKVIPFRHVRIAGAANQHEVGTTSVLLVHRADFRDLFDAGSTPGSPEVQNHHFAAQGIGVIDAAVQITQLEGGSWLAEL